MTTMMMATSMAPIVNMITKPEPEYIVEDDDEFCDDEDVTSPTGGCGCGRRH